MFAPKPESKPLSLPEPMIPRVTVTPLPDDQIKALNASFDPFNQIQHAARMNQWLASYTEQSNAKKIQAYMLRYMDWRTNAEIYHNLNMQIPAPPDPPQLENVEPKPVSYWFGK
jgi:hypothetical protein